MINNSENNTSQPVFDKSNPSSDLNQSISEKPESAASKSTSSDLQGSDSDSLGSDILDNLANNPISQKSFLDSPVFNTPTLRKYLKTKTQKLFALYLIFISHVYFVLFVLTLIKIMQGKTDGTPTALIIIMTAYLVVVCLSAPFSAWFFWKIKNKIAKTITGLCLIASVFLSWAAFEPNLITIQKTSIQTGFVSKFVLISDLHLTSSMDGLITPLGKDTKYLKRLVEEVNKQVDENGLEYVFIAGDFTMSPNYEEIGKMDIMFAPLKNLKVPVYAVLGNHDLEKPGPKLRTELTQALQKSNVKVLNNDIVDLKNFRLVGLGDSWAEEDNVELLDKTRLEENVIVMAHNPDTVLKYSNQKADLTVSGHTHGGQIKIYPIYKPLIPTTGDFDEGLIVQKNSGSGGDTVHKVFVTSGVGETGLYFRLFNPPVIDVISTY